MTWKIPAQFFPSFHFKALLFGCSACLGLVFYSAYQFKSEYLILDYYGRG